MASLDRVLCNACNCCALILTVIAFLFLNGINPFIFTRVHDRKSNIDPWNTYGVLGCIALYVSQFIIHICLPQFIFNFCGLMFYSTSHERPKFSGSFPKLPLVCFRVVTRGNFLELVHQSVSHNLRTCIAVGLDNFTIEVVTDKCIELPSNPKTREVVVPHDYRTKTGILFKARALQYALEDEVNVLEDDDWIVHLDEETLLTESSVRGIIRFALANKHPFGQGLITYGKQQIVNWLITFCDAYRAADDMGKLRFQFSFFHKPYYGWKGSFIVAKCRAEKDVSFDHGIESSIAEDCFFAMVAFNKGYSFEFVEGEMWEKSPFTIMDFVLQRKRWLQGILLIVHSPSIPFVSKILLTLSVYSWIFMPIASFSVVLRFLFPVPLPVIHDILVAFITAVNVYMCIYGAWKCFSIRRLGTVKFFLCVMGTVAALPIKVTLESVAVIWGVFSCKFEFYVVDKKTFLPVCHSSIV